MSESSAPFPLTTAVVPTRRDLLKRAFDILASAIGLLLLSPVFAYLAWRIRRDSPGPAFYFGRRMGRDGKTFRITKFRTMYEAPQSYAGPKVTGQGDARITPLGKWLRESKLNELPQLWNVLKGEMSLVGPRPEDPDIAAGWPEQVQREVLSVRPGITSPASVLYRNEEALLLGEQVMDAYLSEILPSKLRLDQLYVRHHTFWGDLDILFWTALVLVPKEQAPPPEEHLFVGPVSQLVERHLRWALIDSGITLAALALAGLVWRGFGPLDIGIGPAVVLALGFAVLFSLGNLVVGVNHIDWSKAAATDVLDLLPGAGMATILAVIFDYFYPMWLAAGLYGGQAPEWLARPLLPGGLITISAMLAIGGFVVVRYRSRVITGAATRWVNWRGIDKSTHERILIVGSGESGRYAAWLLGQGRYTNAYRVVGFVDDDLYKHDTRIQGLPVLGTRVQIAQIVMRYDIGVIVFAIHNISALGRQSVLEICQRAGAEVVMFPNIPATLSELRGSNAAIQHDSAGERPSRPRAAQPVTAAWLARMEAGLQAGDVAGVQQEIEAMRERLLSMDYDDAAHREALHRSGLNGGPAADRGTEIS